MKIRILVITALLIITAFHSYSQTIHHELNVELNIADKSIEVIDSLLIPAEFIENNELITFTLNNNLQIESLSKKIKILPIEQNDSSTICNNYQINVKSIDKALSIPIKYYGKISGDISTGADEYARGFSETSGLISDEGVYLAGSTYWVPTFGNALISYNLNVQLLKDWNVVSQGTRTINELIGEKRKVKYESPHPTEEVYLVSALWTEYEEKAGDVLVQAFLRTHDEELANKYISATSDYLKMYVDLIGPYPYQKFALVENFWETGYGMPSFTLLGEKIIRFPWILYTSYPHELLHNWWGNSVYVDFDKGNWCEGLTAYMADHLLKEQQGQGAEYRRNTLQKFSDYVNNENDFPVINFRSRNNSAEEAIGYGKSLMFFHTLRKQLGDAKFIEGFQKFYIDNKFKISTFDDIRESLQEFSKNDLTPEFDQYLTRKGAPEIKLSDIESVKVNTGYLLNFSLSQTQPGDMYSLNIPVAIYFAEDVELKNLPLNTVNGPYSFSFKEAPVKIEVDPQFDVFRRLDKAEVPPSLSQVFGAADGVIILPKNSSLFEEYSSMATTWKQTQESQGKSITIVNDKDIEELPDGKAVWVLGFDNKFVGVFSILEDYSSVFDTDQTKKIKDLSKSGSLVYTIPNPENKLQTIGFVGTNIKEAVPGLTRLLSHYGKYSYLGFEGERPNNILKGSFPTLDSPLHYNIEYDGKELKSTAKLVPSKALVK